MTKDGGTGGTGGTGERNRTLCRPTLHEELALGERDLRRAFEAADSRIVPAGTALISPDRPSEALFRLRRGWACRIAEWPDGRRATREVYCPGDMIGLGAALRARPSDTVVAAEALTVRALDVGIVAGLLARPATATYLAWLMGEAQLRADHRADMLARLDPRERVASMLLELFDRLRRRELIPGTSFNLPLTPQQIGDYLGLTVVHVNRTFRQLREEKVVILDNRVVIIRDMWRLRELANGALASFATGPVVRQQSPAERSPLDLDP